MRRRASGPNRRSAPRPMDEPGGSRASADGHNSTTRALPSMLSPGTLSRLMSKHENLSAEAATWLAVASGQAELKLSQAGTALRMDFDFKGGGGFVVARRVIERAMPEDYTLRLRLRGRGPLNNLEIKLVDGTGQNVWRYVKK